MFRLNCILLISFFLGGCSLFGDKGETSPKTASAGMQKHQWSGYNDSVFVADVTIPDGMEVIPGDKFNKIWLVRNTGTTSWKNYKLAFVSGDLMDAPNEVDAPNTPPGMEVEIKVSMRAPGLIGSYTGYWRLKNDKGEFFGHTLWINIKAKD
jgi:next-to-BRCA1 protein 1